MTTTRSPGFELTSAAALLGDGNRRLAVIGRVEELRESALQSALPEALAAQWTTLVDHLADGDGGGKTSTWAGPRQCTIGAIPTICARHNTASRPDVVVDHVKGTAGDDGVDVLLVPADPAWAPAWVCAVARAFPTYSSKKGSEEDASSIRVAVWGDPDLADTGHVCEGIRLAAHLVDMPPNELTTTRFVAEARSVGEAVGATVTVIEGEALRDGGFGGLWNVGMASVYPPAMVVLEAGPETETQVCWVGKGIVYDTGGLSIKGKGHMVGMKCDMGGAAAVLGAFSAAARRPLTQRLIAVLCIAENSVDKVAFRPDDVIRLYSGKTVEVNNTDAEGRLVLGDGVAWCTRERNPSLVVDLATLTGAQLVATGHRFAGIVCNDDAVEARAVTVGKATGDLVHPLPYAPEFFRSEFKSKVADLKNSVKDRMNAQTSCAGQFVAEHLVDYEGAWLHVDLAGPAFKEERGTGYGVALLCGLIAD